MQLPDDVRALLGRRLLAHVTTINPDGYPHTVPIWYIIDGDDIVIATGPNSRKVNNIRTNPKGAVTVGGEPLEEHQGGYGTGYLFQGEWAIEGEPGFEWIRRIAPRYWDDPARVARDIAAWGPHQALRFMVAKITQVME